MHESGRIWELTSEQQRVLDELRRLEGADTEELLQALRHKLITGKDGATVEAGTLIGIPDAELPRLQAATQRERQAWYRKRKAERKRQREARRKNR